jgi:hypothetical protein
MTSNPAASAGVYSSERAYLNAAMVAGTNDAQAKIKEKPIDENQFAPVVVRA